MEKVSNMAPGAELLAKFHLDGDGCVIIMALEKGAELANGGVTLNRAVCFSLPGLFPSDGGPFKADRMTAEAWVLYDASIAWRASSPDADGLVTTGRIQSLTIRREDQLANPGGVSFEWLQFFARTALGEPLVQSRAEWFINFPSTAMDTRSF